MEAVETLYVCFTVMFTVFFGLMGFVAWCRTRAEIRSAEAQARIQEAIERRERLKYEHGQRH